MGYHNYDKKQERRNSLVRKAVEKAAWHKKHDKKNVSNQVDIQDLIMEQQEQA